MNRVLRVLVAVLLLSVATTGVGLVAPDRVAGPVAQAAPTRLTNLAHPDFLLDDVELDPVPGHTTYRLAAEPEVRMPWTYASGEPVYDPATGVTNDGVSAEGVVNRNSGAESTIHGQLSMLALDAHPGVGAMARGLSEVEERDGLRMVTAESATSTTGTRVAAEPAWTGESQWEGAAFLRLRSGQRASWELPSGLPPSWAEPVLDQPERLRPRSAWRTPGTDLGVLRHGVGAQGITAVPGALVPQRLTRALPAGAGRLSVTGTRGTVDLDAVLLRPLVGRAVLSGSVGRVELAHSTLRAPRVVVMGQVGARSRVVVYDRAGRTVASAVLRGAASVALPAGGFAVAKGE